MSLDYYLNNISDNLYRYLVETECTMISLSKKCNLSVKSLEHVIYRNRGGVNFDTLVKISHGIEMPISFLIG